MLLVNWINPNVFEAYANQIHKSVWILCVDFHLYLFNCCWAMNNQIAQEFVDLIVIVYRKNTVLFRYQTWFA